MTEIFETIYPYIIAALPALTSIFSVIAAIIKIAKDNKESIKPIVEELEKLKQEVKDSKEYADLKEKLIAVISQNAQLRKELDELITLTGKVKHDSQI